MGTGLAETMGVAMSGKFSKLLCVVGDGSFLMNVQDLQAIRQNNLKDVILVIYNNGYLAIRQTQKEFLGGRYYGTHPEWNLTMPSVQKIASAFEFDYEKIENAEGVDSLIEKLVKKEGPVICEVVVDDDQAVLFKQGYKSNDDGTFSPQPLEEMAPFIAE